MFVFFWVFLLWFFLGFVWFIGFILLFFDLVLLLLLLWVRWVLLFEMFVCSFCIFGLYFMEFFSFMLFLWFEFKFVLCMSWVLFVLYCGVILSELVVWFIILIFERICFLFFWVILYFGIFCCFVDIL